MAVSPAIQYEAFFFIIIIIIIYLVFGKMLNARQLP